MKSHYGLSHQENQGMLRGSHQWAFKHHGQSTVYWPNSHTAQFSSAAQSCPALWDPMDHSTPGFPVLHRLLEFAQTRVLWVNDAIQPSHLLVPFSCLQSFPASGSFPVSQFFASHGQSTGISISHSPTNAQKEQKSAMKYLPRNGATRNISWKALMSTSEYKPNISYRFWKIRKLIWKDFYLSRSYEYLGKTHTINIII